MAVLKEGTSELVSKFYAFLFYFQLMLSSLLLLLLVLMFAGDSLTE